MADRGTRDDDDDWFALDGKYFQAQAKDALWSFFHPWSFGSRDDAGERERPTRD